MVQKIYFGSLFVAKFYFAFSRKPILSLLMAHFMVHNLAQVMVQMYSRQQVKITRNAENSFQEFPENENLIDFDKSDRKFVAVALTHPEKPPILNAVDSDWKNFEMALNNIGITIIFLCPELTTRP